MKSSKNLYDATFIDPLYRPYQTDYNFSPYKHPGVINTGYPQVDPYRRHLGWGQIHRSQHEGICPPGFRPGDKNLCYPDEPESYGLFYSDTYDKNMLNYANSKYPYNADVCDYNRFMGDKPSCNGKLTNDCKSINTNNDKLNKRIFDINGCDPIKAAYEYANCITSNFW